MAKTCNTRCNTDHNILLRKNVFYYRVELPRENGKRRFLCKSLKTYNYYEAREKAKIMAERLERMNTQKFMEALDLLWSQVIFEPVYIPLPNGNYAFAEKRIKNTTPDHVIEGLADLGNYVDTIKRSELSPDDKAIFSQFLHYLPDIKDLLEKNFQAQLQTNQLLERQNIILSQQTINAVVAPQPKIVKHTIHEIMVSLAKKNNNSHPESDRKYRALQQTIENVGLKMESDYMEFYTTDTMNKISDVIANNSTIKGDTKRKYIRYVKDLIKHAHILEPDVYKENLVHLLPVFDKTPKAQKRPHMPYTDDQLVKMFDPKHDFFKQNPDQFWVCMISLFTGSRLNAAMTLQYGDVLKKDGLDCINFTQNHPIKHLKTEASERIVPIAKQLLDLGFVDYVRNRQTKLKATDTDFIFPKCQTSGGQENNKFVVRGVLKFLSEIGIKSPHGEKLDFHSFRKNASLRLQEVGILPAFINDIIGWDGKSTMEQSYSNHRLDEIKEQIDKLNYDFLQPHFDKWQEIMKGV